MALTYPRDMTAGVAWQRADIRLRRREQYSRSRSYSQVKDLAEPVWVGDFLSGPMDYDDAAALHAQFEGLAGRSFYTRVFERPEPKEHNGSGNTWTVSAINAGRDVIAIDGTPNGYTVSVGDFIAPEYASGKFALVRILETRTDGGSDGEITGITVSPPLRSEVTTGDEVHYAPALVEMRLDAESLTISPVSGRVLWTVGFTCEELI